MLGLQNQTVPDMPMRMTPGAARRKRRIAVSSVEYSDLQRANLNLNGPETLRILSLRKRRSRREFRLETAPKFTAVMLKMMSKHLLMGTTIKTMVTTMAVQ